MATVLAAVAGFVPLPLPPGASQSDPSSIAEFAASGNAWVARVGAEERLQLTTDQGTTWRAIDLGAQPWIGMAVGPDGSFWVPALRAAQHELVRVTQDGLVSTLDVALPPGQMSPPTWDDQQRMWVALSPAGSGQGGAVSAYRLNADGSVAQQVDGTSSRSRNPFIRFAGATGFVAHEDATLRLDGSKLTLIAGLPSEDSTEFSQTDLWPEDVAGRSIVTFHAVSPDGGRTFVYTDRAQFGVHGNPDLLVRFPFTDQPAAVLLRRCSAFVFCDTGVPVPSGALSVWQVNAGLVAVSTESTAPTGGFGNDLVFAIDRAAIPRQAANVGRSNALMARLNFNRRRAGLPPLVVDARMSAAALAHARYLVRNVKRSKLDLSNAHTEVPGRHGYTGADPSARCVAQKTVCTNEEVITGRRPSDILASLYYHRLAPMSPYTQYGGAASAGGFTVYELDTQAQAFVVQPSGYPSGHYDGPLTLQGPELPDPYLLCKPLVFNEHAYHGVPVTFTPAGREPARPRPNGLDIRVGPDSQILSVRLFIGKRPVPGCQNHGTFLPKPALRPHTTYTARASWKPTPAQPVQTYIWKFRTR